MTVSAAAENFPIGYYNNMSSSNHHRRSDSFLVCVNIVTRKKESSVDIGLEDLAARTCVIMRSDGKFQLPFLHLHLSESSSSFFPTYIYGSLHAC